MSTLKKPLCYDETTGEVRQFQPDETVDAPVANPECLSLTNGEAGAVVIGTPVYVSAAGTVKKAQANAAATTHVLGLVKDSSVEAVTPGSVTTDGPLTATPEQWDAVTGQTGGLTPGARYFLDPATAGRLTLTPPAAAGQFCAPIGRALSSTSSSSASVP